MREILSILQETETGRAEGQTSYWQNQNPSPGPSEFTFYRSPSCPRLSKTFTRSTQTVCGRRSLGASRLLAIVARVTAGTSLQDYLGWSLEIVPASCGSVASP